MPIKKLLIMVILLSMLLAACAPAAEPGAPQSPAVPTPAADNNQPPAAVTAARQALAQRLGIDASTVEVRSIKEMQWPNACLGLQQPDELCAEMVTPGYQVTLAANGTTYETHTNEDGSVVRFAEQAEGPKSGPQANPAVQAAINFLAQQLGVSVDQIQVVQSEHVDWPNGCLGVEMPGRMCTQLVTPGYRVVLSYDGKQYEFHTDETGGAVYSAVAPLPETANKVVVWEQTEGSVCSRVEIGVQGAAYGECDKTLQETELQPERVKQLEYLYANYSSFTEGTQAGTVIFQGQGQQQATPAEMRSIAEWAKLVFMEAQGGRGGAAWGLAFSWHREGGIAGFCDDLGVYFTGWAMPTSCKGGQAKDFGQYRLTADDLEQMYQWVDAYQSFDYEVKDAATTDAMQTVLNFQGNGSVMPSAEQQQEIAQFAAQVYSKAIQ